MAQAWKGDGDPSMKSHRPRALAELVGASDMRTIIAAGAWVGWGRVWCGRHRQRCDCTARPEPAVRHPLGFRRSTSPR
ncbi:hypothetical protein MPRM_46020 [Mycobacterium parmense]|uniref:Uncharacterized protein n=1 Tax=Mycobacterium parmense TaxID=185642 RepID=A0A7I7Z345_9MYCO|nr:hypothetical protein MPRM_46020 [Mycobacterium parmense]